MATGLSVLPFQRAGRVSLAGLPFQIPHGLHTPSSCPGPSTRRRRPSKLACNSMEPHSQQAYQCLSIDTTSKKTTSTSTHSELYNKIPPLAESLIIEGITLQREVSAMDVATAKDRITSIVTELWPNSPGFLSYCDLSMSMSQFFFAEAKLDQFVTIVIVYALLFVIDDFFDRNTRDSPNSSASQLMNSNGGIDMVGINRGINLGTNPGTLVWEWLRKVDELLRQEEMPAGPCTPVERIMWVAGQELQRMSTPGFLNYFVEAVLEHHRAYVASRADFASDRASLRDVDAYMQMRLGNSGGVLTLVLVEFANDEFLSDEVREHPFTVEMTNAAIAHGIIANDLFSYCKEVEESNPCNIVTVLMETEAMSLPQAAWRAVELANAYHRGFVEVERRLQEEPGFEPVKGSRAALQRYLRRLRELYSGNLYWSTLVKRYRAPDSVYPELRAIPYPRQLLQRPVRHPVASLNTIS